MKRPANILLVEDNKMDVALTLDAFREARLENKIQLAANGQEALDYVFGHSKFSDRQKYPIPDIILLDLKLPGISGLDVLREIKNTNLVKRIPVIVLTSSREEGDRAMSYDLGANSYLVKPISFSGFIDVVRKISDYWFSLNVEPPR
ncbi:MAG: response regulator [Bacteroidales bacterium]|nr:response regulator [Bacteroidales bacterium]